MARKSGDVTVSTLRLILAAMVENGHDKLAALDFLFALNEAEDGDSFDLLVKLAKEQEKDRSGYVPGKGKSLGIDEAKIAAECLAQFARPKALGIGPMTPEILAAMPDENPMKKVFVQRIKAAIDKAKAAARESRESRKLAAMLARFEDEQIAAE